MRLSLLALVMAVVPAFAGTSLGTVAVDTTLRGSPRLDSVDAGMLTAGSTVVVHHEDGDWYAIQSPRGCVSWISHLFIEFPDKAGPFPKNAVVRSEGEVKLAVGKAGVPKPLDIRKTVVSEGTIVLVIGAAVKNDNDKSTWYPIIPPEDDFRYVPKSAVKFGSGTPATFVVKSPTPSGMIPASSPSPAMIAGGTSVGKTHPLWIQAEAAEKAGDWDRAERLYFQLAKEMNGPGGDSELANQCYSRVHSIRERRRTGQAAPPAGNSNWTGTAPPTVVAATKPEAMQAELAKSEPVNPITPVVEKRITTEDVTPREKVASAGQWTGSGYLRLAGFKVGGKQAYALEDTRGRLLYYAVANGIELDRYRNKTVDLFGIMTSPKDLRGVALVDASKIDLVK